MATSHAGIFRFPQIRNIQYNSNSSKFAPDSGNVEIRLSTLRMIPPYRPN